MPATDQARRPEPGTSFFWLAYGQVAALLAAFSLLVFLTHFFDVGLKGLVREAFDVWTDHVRPFVGWPLQALVGLSPWRVEVPDIVKDYLAVGLVLALSFHRMTLVLFAGRFPREMGYALWLVVCGLLWPLAVPWTIRDVSDRRALKAVVIWLAPLLYLVLLFVANWIL